MIQPSTAEQLVEQLVAGMDKVLEQVKPELDKVEEQLLKGMADFGADTADVENVRKWLRPMMESEVRKQIFERVTKGL